MANRTSVYTGFWIDHSHSTVEGATVTLTTQNSAFLLAFLATYVSIAGGSFWYIIAFAAHQLRASKHGSPTRQDGFLWKLPIILRNTTGPLGTAWKISKLSCASRNREDKKFQWTPLLIIALALLTSAGFAVAGIFSSLVTKAAGENVRLQGNECGLWSGTPNDSYFTKLVRDVTASAAYAHACYSFATSTTTERLQQCGFYVNKQLSWETNTNASCPFAPGMCILGDYGAFEMDTGPINSHENLGLNGPIDARVTIRKVTTCAPIITRPFVYAQNITTNAGQWTDTQWSYLYGSVDPYPFSFAYNIHASSDIFQYGLSAIKSYAGGLFYDAWSPIPQLNRSDADVSLFFLTPNGVAYDTIVDDPWFSAHTSYGLGNSGFYESDKYVQVMGCIDQYQVCNPNIKGNTSDTGCTSLTGAAGIWNELANIGLSTLQIATLARMTWMEQLNTANIVMGRGPSALNAIETLYDFSQASLPSNQWTIELNWWFATSLAWLQEAVVEVATGPINVPDNGFIQHPTDAEDVLMCSQQMAGSMAGYQNFSLLGICIIVIIGGIIIAIGLFIDTIVGAIQKRLKRNASGRQAWKDHENIELAEALMSEDNEGSGASEESRASVAPRAKTQMISVHRDIEQDAEDRFLSRTP